MIKATERLVPANFDPDGLLSHQSTGLSTVSFLESTLSAGPTDTPSNTANMAQPGPSETSSDNDTTYEHRSATSSSAYVPSENAFTTTQLEQIVIIVAGIINGNRTDRRAGSLPPSSINGGMSNSSSSFDPKMVGFFKPDPDKPALEAKDSYNIYHNVYSFITKLKVRSALHVDPPLQNNVENCLLGAAERSFTEELNELSCSGLRYDPSITMWCTALEPRFKQSPNRTLATLEQLRFTVRDIRASQDPMTFLSEIKIRCQNSGTLINESAQAMLAWERMDPHLRQHIPQPGPVAL